MTNPSRRLRRQGLHVPRSAWPTFLEFAAVGSGDHDELGEVFQATHDRLAARLADRRKRTEIRWGSFDADDARDVMRSLKVDPDDHRALLAFLDLHPLGSLVIAWAEAEPDPRRYVILGGGGD